MARAAFGRGGAVSTPGYVTRRMVKLIRPPSGSKVEVLE
jgi:hypothetical protein